MVLRIGTALVDAHAHAGHTNRAVRLADTLNHNVRSSRSVVAPEVLDFADTLAMVLIRAERPADAIAVYEDLLREIDDVGAYIRGEDSKRNGGFGNGEKKRNGGTNGLDKDHRGDFHHDPATLCAAACRAMRGIRMVLRSAGGWNALGSRGAASKRMASELCSRVRRLGNIDMPDMDTWETADGSDDKHEPFGLRDRWSIVVEKEKEEKESRDYVMQSRERWGIWDDRLVA